MGQGKANTTIHLLLGCVLYFVACLVLIPSDLSRTHREERGVGKDFFPFLFLIHPPYTVIYIEITYKSILIYYFI